MTVDVTGSRPRAISPNTATALDEYRRFRHVVRNVYAFELDPRRIEQLTIGLRPAFSQASAELEALADFLDGMAQEG